MKRSDKAFALSAFALAAAAGLALSAESAAQPAIAAEAALSEEQGSGPTVSVVTAEQTAFTETVLVTGSLIARNEVLVTPQIEGLRIREILAEEGDRVAAGQVLARLVDDTLKAQLAQLEANLLRAGAPSLKPGAASPKLKPTGSRPTPLSPAPRNWPNRAR